MTHCNLCETSTEMSMKEALSKMFHCKVCRRDVDTRGAITGLGFLVFKCLQKKFGKSFVCEHWRELESLEKSVPNLL